MTGRQTGGAVQGSRGARSGWPEPLPAPARLVRHLGLRPSRALGQNFLRNQQAAAKIAEMASELPGGPIVEIGPGLGHLTQELVRLGRPLLLVEKDPVLAEHLLQWFSGCGLVEVSLGDARGLDWGQAAERLGSDWVVAVGNLPFSVASEVLLHALASPVVVGALFMVQWEVARRLVAGPGTKDYGSLSVACQLSWRPEIRLHLRPGSFDPEPEVGAGVVAFTRIEDADPDRAALGGDLAKRLFAYRRKTLRKALKQVGCPDPEEVLARAGLSAEARPEALSPGDFLTLALALQARRE